MYKEQSAEDEISRIRMPKAREMFSVVLELLGAGRVRVKCADGKTRIGRIKGKIKKRIWIKISDIVLIEPWIVQSDERCDVIWKYTRTQASWLKQKGKLEGLDVE